MTWENFTERSRGILFIVLSVAALGYVYQYGHDVEQSASAARTFSADGDGTVNVVPDVAKFSVSLISEGGKNVSDIQNQNIEKMNAVNTYLKTEGVDLKDLQTTNYSLSPRYSYATCSGNGQSLCPPPSITGYTLTQSLSVKVRDLGNLGDILSGVITQGANTVSDVSFVVDDPTAAKNQARAMAIAKAKQNALDIANAGGFRVGRITSLYEDQGGVVDGVGGGMNIMKSAEVAPTIERGTNEIKSHVTVTYEIVN